MLALEDFQETTIISVDLLIFQLFLLTFASILQYQLNNDNTDIDITAIVHTYAHFPNQYDPGVHPVGRASIPFISHVSDFSLVRKQ